MSVVNIASLGISVKFDQAEKAKAAVDNLAGSAPKAERAIDRLRGAFDKLGVAGQTAVGVFAGMNLAGIVDGIAGSVGGLVSNFLEINRESGKMKASLETVMGGADAAKKAFADIEKFANTTPFTLSQVSEAFIKLKALGLDPGEESLKSYGNTAAAMGKPIMQFIEAVADASTGEMERLKEFGIKAKQSGDTVSFTFQGVTKTIKNNAEEVQKYLKGIGLNQFAGAMERQMKTMDGAISNMQDAWDSFMRALGETGIIDLVTEGIRGITVVLGVLKDNVNTVAGVMAGAFAAAITLLVGTLLPGMVGGIMAVVTAMKALTTWMLRNPLTALFTAISIAVGFFVTAILDAADETEVLLKRTVSIGEVIKAVWVGVGELFSLVWTEVKNEFSSTLDVMMGMASGFWQSVQAMFSGDFTFSALGDAMKQQVDSVDWGAVWAKAKATIDPAVLAPRIERAARELPKAPEIVRDPNADTSTAVEPGSDKKKTKEKKPAKAKAEKIPGINRELDDLREQIALDKIRLDGIGKEESATQKLVMMAEMKNRAAQDGVAWTRELEATTKGLVEQYVNQDRELSRLLDLWSDAKNITEDMMTSDEHRLENLKQLDEMLKRNMISQETYNRKIKEMADDALEDSLEFEDGLSRAFKSLNEEASDHATLAEDVVLTGFAGMSDALAEFAMTGKLNFKDFAQSILADMARIAARAALLQIFQTAVNAYTGTSTTTTATATPTAANANVPQFRDGGVMTPWGPVPLKKYARGGIANTPQLALYGEGDKSEAIVPLPDGRSIPVKIEEGTTRRGPSIVNNINTTIQTGNDVDPNRAKEYAKQFNSVTEKKWDQKMDAYRRSAQNRKLVG